MRIVSVWLPRWPILRFLATQTASAAPRPADPDAPLVLAVDAAGGPRVAAANAAAHRQGVRAGDLVADARARTDLLQVYPRDAPADAAALQRLALWATRYTPAVAVWDAENGGDGFFLDITGAAHLFDGEAALIADLAQRLAAFGLPARLAVAATPGAAWALSHYHPDACLALPQSEAAAALAALPIEALRLSAETSQTLRRLGFKRIRTLVDTPRAPLAARFENDLLRRLDQAFGRISEPLAFVTAPPIYHSLRYLLEPVVSQDAVVAVTTRLMKDVAHLLARDAAAARALRLSLYRVDGAMTAIDIGLAAPTTDPAHVARLVGLKLERLGETLDAGFGYEALGLAVLVVEPVAAQQTDLLATAAAQAAQTAALIDTLAQRLGPARVRRLAPRASHLPECAEIAVPALTAAAPAWTAPDQALPRPPLMLREAEPVDVIALVPDGPPQRFRWRGTLYEVARAQGPERLADEWWHAPAPTRDYYLIEDMTGHRFWLYRAGLYGRDDNGGGSDQRDGGDQRDPGRPGWFLHGLFA